MAGEDAPDGPPPTRAACRERLAVLQDEAAAIKAQIAAADLDRQARRGRVDPRWFHRAKTALRHRQHEIATLTAHMASLPLEASRKDLFKDCLIEVLREDYEDGAWAAALAEARRRHGAAGGGLMAPLPPPPTPTLDAVYKAYEAEAGEGLREHLGASLIGKECARALWYDFRWVTPVAWPGRMLRLFDTGQREEGRLVRDLRRTGATVLDVDPATGRQWRVEAHGGHFGGSLDAVAIGLLEAPRTWHVLEFKTSATKGFQELRQQGVKEARPRHHAQIQVYLHLTGIGRAMYIVVCKETDELYIERIVADPVEGKRLLAKAGRIIFAQHPPSRISDDPNSFLCRLCEHRGLCHEGEAALRTCRSCLHSTPVEAGWHCARWDGHPGPADQRRGCGAHLYIPDLVPGEVIDAGLDHVDYRLADGGVWRDGPRAAA